jgi:hypothetical protein
MTNNQMTQTANLIVEEAFTFYANKFNVTVEQVKDAVLLGNKKVMDDMAVLFQIGFKNAIDVLSK